METILVLLVLINLAVTIGVKLKVILYIDDLSDIKSYCLTIGSALYSRNEVRIISKTNITLDKNIMKNQHYNEYYNEYYNEILTLDENDTVLLAFGHNIIQRDINENDVFDNVTFSTEVGCWPFTHPHPHLYSCPLMQGEQYMQDRRTAPKACTMLREKAEKIDEINKDRLSVFLHSGLGIGKVHQLKKFLGAMISLDQSLPPLCKNYGALASWLYIQEDMIKLDYSRDLLVSAFQNHLNFKFDYKEGLWMFGEGIKPTYPLAIAFHGDTSYYSYFYNFLRKNESIDHTISINGNSKSFMDVCDNEIFNVTKAESDDDACMYGYNIISKYDSFTKEFYQWRFGCICITKSKKIEMKGWFKTQHYEYYMGQIKKFFTDVSQSSDLLATGCGFIRDSDDGSLPVELADELLKNGSPMLSHSFRKPARSIIFFPDFHFIEKQGFKALVEHIATSGKEHKFEHQVSQVFWRGSTTGVAESCFDLPRFKACNLSSLLPWCNFKFTKVIDGCEPGSITKELLSPYTEELEWLKYKGILNIDGHVNAWGLLWRLASKSVLFSVESEHTNSYIELMIPWQHYVPLKADFSDLAEHTKLVTSKNFSEVLMLKNIVENANKLAQSFTYESEVDRVARELSTVWQLAGEEESGLFGN